MTDEYQIDNVTWAEKDSNGNIVVDPDVVNTDDINIGDSDLVSSGDFLSVGPTYGPGGVNSFSTTSSTYTTDRSFWFARETRETWLPTGASGGYHSELFKGDSGTADVRLQNVTDGDTVWEITGISGGESISRIDIYTPPQTVGQVAYELQIRSTNGSNVTLSDPTINAGIQL